VENTVKPDRQEMTIWRMRVVCWITMATETHSEYVILISFFHGNNGYTKAPRYYVYTNIASLVWYLILEAC